MMKKSYTIFQILEYYEKLSYMEGFGKTKSSLNYGGDLDLTLRKKSERKRVVVERQS
jgi:hypothetical protein